ncbi:MAG: hypothetical protein DCC58_06170 [Chloroflexi bacterium]|nr:MAG: hypothetical protein DCC58_06170 [Chloroflexota bacterium]
MLVFSTLGASAVTTNVVVTQNDVGFSWITADTRSGGNVSFVAGPATAPLSDGSLQMTTTDANGASNAKAQLVTGAHVGTPLSAIDALSFWDYRASASTNPVAQRMGLNVAVDFVGNGASFTTLVFEPVYQPGGVSALLTDTWQYWDAFDGGDAIWWSTKDIPGVCAFTCYVTWDTILANNPNAKISGAFGFNVGSGWTGQFSGNADALTVGVSGNSTVYDFEPLIGPPTNKDECKNGGWMIFNNPTFKNQGQCIQYVNTGK